MRLALVPGYRSLFGEPQYSYEELMKDIPSQLGILIAVALNGELSLPDPDGKVQYRLMAKMCHRFTPEQKQYIFAAFQNYRTRTNGHYQNELFERWYLLEMITRELNRNAVFKAQDTGSQQEYNFLMAYLLVIDEVHKKQDELNDLASKSEKDELFPLRMIWTGLLYQFQFQEKPDPSYEFYKLSSILNYARLNFRSQLREYLHQLGFKTIGNLMGSFLQVVQKGLQPNDDKFLPSLNYFSPLEGVDDSHLRSQAINSSMGQKLKTSDLRKFPLFHRPEKGYAVIDQEFNLKKIYRGPLFELRVNTSLRKKMEGDTYNSNIAKYVMEEICFKSILQSMKRKARDILLFDNGSNNCPDAYYRLKKTIFLFEFKGYLFPDKQLENPDFDLFKKYLDERFVSNSDGKPKGISQLLRQIDLIASNEALFDKSLLKASGSGKLKIYPIICFDDFYFTMPGVNEYLNKIFLGRINPEIKERFEIMPLTLINLDVFFYLSVRKSSFEDIEKAILRYINIIKGRVEKHKKTGLPEDLLAFHSSFDEIFHTKIIHEFAGRLSHDPLTTLLKSADITQEALDESV